MKKKCFQLSLATLSITAMSCFLSCVSDSEYNPNPEIVTQPKDLTVFVGDTISTNCLTVEAIDAEGDEIFYQWYILVDTINGDNPPIPSATENVFIPNKSVADTSIYFVVVSGAGSGTTSASLGATVIVLDTTVQNILLK